MGFTFHDVLGLSSEVLGRSSGIALGLPGWALLAFELVVCFVLRRCLLTELLRPFLNALLRPSSRFSSSMSSTWNINRI